MGFHFGWWSSPCVYVSQAHGFIIVATYCLRFRFVTSHGWWRVYMFFFCVLVLLQQSFIALAYPSVERTRWGKPTSTCESKLFQWTISLKCLSVVTFKQIDVVLVLHTLNIYKYELIRCALFGHSHVVSSSYSFFPLPLSFAFLHSIFALCRWNASRFRQILPLNPMFPKLFA